MNLREDINYSIWCDFIERDFLENEFQNIINENIVHGATSNPAIFQQSISTSSAYTQQINMLQANENKKIYEELVITDIKRAAEILKPLHDKDANDGFISIEVDPTLCNDMMGTIEEGARLYSQIGFDNVMIKIPATKAGYGAMEHLTSMGINVNATLIFSPHQAEESAKALNSGIKKSGKDTKGVVSIFVSRFDRLLDEKLKNKDLEVSKVGIVNATKCYYKIEKFNNANIRTLFASTGVKGDDLVKSYYIDKLIFPNSINTAPLATINSWIKDGSKVESEILDEDLCDKYLEDLKSNQIDINSTYSELLQDGLSAFKVSFEELLKKVKLS
ncbi:MAG: transaldolase [Campylobacterota bacterium]|nr:transaldolase [Campylobacterota bacterium]